MDKLPPCQQKLIQDNIISTLVRLDQESKGNISLVEFSKRSIAISSLLNKIETDFGVKYMFKILNLTSKILGHQPGLLPVDLLHTELVTELVDLGCKIKSKGKESCLND